MFLSGKDLFRYRANQIGTFALMITMVLATVSFMALCVIYC